jgi:hypothetical protein
MRPRGSRHEMLCDRDDGSSERIDLGPSLPFHDVAHFVAETRLGLKGGYFGNLAGGMSARDLADPAVIRSLPSEAYVAEICARAVGALATGACRVAQFGELVGLELEGMSIDVAATPGLAPLGRNDAPACEVLASELLLEFNALTARYRALADGEFLELEY